MTVENIAQVRQWLDRMRPHLQKAIILSQKMDGEQLSEDDDLFWSLAKYAENVQECAVQLDKINKSVFPCLSEFPMKSEQDELSWAGLKGMRIRLAHKFWDIDPTVVWSTVTRDFPQLESLLGSLVVSDSIGAIEDQPVIAIEGKRFRELPPAEEGATIELGKSIPFLYFDSSGKAQCLRIGRSLENRLLLAHSKTGSVRMTVSIVRWP